MSEEAEDITGLWLLTFSDGFCFSWTVFYAPSWEDAERQVQEWIEQLPYRALDVKLRTFP